MSTRRTSHPPPDTSPDISVALAQIERWVEGPDDEQSRRNDLYGRLDDLKREERLELAGLMKRREARDTLIYKHFVGRSRDPIVDAWRRIALRSLGMSDDA